MTVLAPVTLHTVGVSDANATSRPGALVDALIAKGASPKFLLDSVPKVSDWLAFEIVNVATVKPELVSSISAEIALIAQVPEVT
jgi:hypothetical protein